MRKTKVKNFFCKSSQRKLMSVFLLTIVMVLTMFNGIAANTISQDQRVSLNFERAKIKTIFNEITKQTSYTFFYSGEKLDVNKEVKAKYSYVSLDKILGDILDKRFSFRYEDDIIVIFPRDKNDNKSNIVKGIIKDKKGNPLPGVTVSIKGTSVGTASDSKGGFTIKASKGDILKISFIGMKTQYKTITDFKKIIIVLKEEISKLEEVVVTGFQTIEKGRATGSFAIVNTEELDKIHATDFRKKLEGISTGVYVGSDNKIIIRGINTFNGTTDPLIVVDGVPTDVDLESINPNDIKQISILKDAASAAIWGVRSSNGVIVVTTHRGSKNKKTAITYRSDFTIEEQMKMSDFHYMSSGEYIDGEWDRYNSPGTFSNNNFTSYSQVGYVYQDYLNATIGLSDEAKAPYYNLAMNKLNELKKYTNHKDIEKYFYRPEFTQKHNLSISTGSENANSYISLSYSSVNGELKGDDSERFNLLYNSDITLSKKLKLSSSLRSSYLKKDMNGTKPNLRPYERILDESGDYVNYHQTLHRDHAPKYEAIGMNDWTYNPLKDRQHNKNTYESRSLAVVLGLSYDILDGLTFDTNFSYDYEKNGTETIHNKYSYARRDLYNQLTHVLVDDDNNPTEIVDYHLGKSGGIFKSNTVERRTVIWRNKLAFKKTFNDFRITAIVGIEHNDYHGVTDKHSRFGIDPETNTYQTVNFKDWINGELIGYDEKNVKGSIGQSYQPYNSEILDKYVSYYTTGSVTFKDRYDLFFSARLDKTNLLVKASKYRDNPTWSIGGKWDISREDFFKSDFCSKLSLKMSYGLSGLMNRRFLPDVTAERKLNFYRTSFNSVTIKNPENKQLRWEKTKIFNIGVTATLFDKLNIDLEVYNKKTTDILSSISGDPTTGWATLFINAANLSNKGFDLSLNYQIIDGIVGWNMGVNYSYNKNEVTKMNFTPTVSNMIMRKPMLGQAISPAFYIKYAGLDVNGNPQVMKKGDDTVYPYTELAAFTADDYYFGGSFNPPSFGSVSSNLSYKDFSFNILCTYKFGHKFRMPNTSNTRWSGQKAKWNSSEYRWIEGADNTGKMLGKMLGSAEDANWRYAYNFSDYQLEDGDVVRLKSVSLKYDFSKYLKNMFVKNATITVSGENLWFWAANREGLDSDYGYYEWDAAYYTGSLRKRFVASFNLKF